MAEELIGEGYREAQQSLIGSVLIDPGPVLGQVMDGLTEEDFEGEYRTVFAAVRALWLAREPVDPVTVLAKVGDGYEPMLRQCMQLTPTAANAGAYARLVRDGARLLAMRTAGARLAGAPDEAAARAILADAEALLADRSRQRVFGIRELLEQFYTGMDGPKPVYLPWGIRALNEKLTCELGDLVILGADSSVGKTALATQFAWEQAARGYRVGFFSLETRSGKLTNRIVSQRARVPGDAIKQRQFQDNDYREVLTLLDGVGKMNLDIIEASSFGVDDIRALTVSRRYQVIYLDYLQLIRGEGESRPEIVTNVSIALHALAQDLGVTVVALSQVTPADKTKKARQNLGKEDLRESRQLIHDADVILMMALANADDPGGLRWLSCAKNKEGELPSVCLEFDAQHMDFQATDSRYFKKPAAPSKFTEVPVQEAIPWP